jgi:hypothetical protein
MAYNFDPGAGLMGGQGILAQPATITNPLAPQPPPDEATLKAMAEARAKRTALEKALYRAQVLREQPGGGFAQGAGPLGIRQGVGPMGFMTSIGDAIAGVIAKKRQGQGAEEVTGAMGPLSAAEQQYIQDYLNSMPGQQQPYGRSPMSYVPQGSPLSLGNQ